jgi:hypothetical protein
MVSALHFRMALPDCARGRQSPLGALVARLKFEVCFAVGLEFLNLGVYSPSRRSSYNRDYTLFIGYECDMNSQTSV